MHNYKELKVWQKAMDFVVTVYALTKKFPKDKLFGLTSQLRRATISVSLNIAEGAGRESGAEFARFLDIALGSSYESIVALLIAHRLGYCGLKESNALVEQAEELARMLTGLIKHYAPNREYLK
jgi:four helix bundle protein